MEPQLEPPDICSHPDDKLIYTEITWNEFEDDEFTQIKVRCGECNEDV